MTEVISLQSTTIISLKATVVGIESANNFLNRKPHMRLRVKYASCGYDTLELELPEGVELDDQFVGVISLVEGCPAPAITRDPLRQYEIGP